MTTHHLTDCHDNDDQARAAALAAVYAFIDCEHMVDDREPQVVELESSWAVVARLGYCRPGCAAIDSPLPGSWRRRPWTAMTFLAILITAVAVMLVALVPAAAELLHESHLPEGSANYLNPAGSVLPFNSQVNGSKPGALPAESVKPVTLRIALALGVGQMTVAVPDGAELLDLVTGKSIAIDPGSCFTVLKSNLNQLCPNNNVLLKPSGQDGLFGINGRFYRGCLLICHLPDGRLNFVNIIDLEEYLLSVVPCEMPSAWPLEALKAQAVAARSYAMANLGQHEKDGYDLGSTGAYQVYTGISSETLAGNLAVAQTAGLVLKHEGHVIPAFFHCTSGGFTEPGENVWGKALVYLKSVPDYDDSSPFFTWSRTFTLTAAAESLHSSGFDTGQLLGMSVVERTPSGRARKVLVEGREASRVIAADNFRHIFNLPSTNFNLVFDQHSYLFAGRGCGHGLGLSQWGAKALAENGYNAAQILAYYYKDVSLDYL